MPAAHPVLDKLRVNCQAKQAVVLLPEDADQRVLQAAEELLREGLTASVVFMSRKADVMAAAVRHGIDLAGFADRVQSSADLCPNLAEQTLGFLREKAARKNRPTNEDEIRALSADLLVQAGTLLELGLTHAVVAGAVHPTAAVIRAGLRTVGLAPGVGTVSGAFLMTRWTEAKAETLLFADCGVVVNPSPEQLADIAAGTARTWESLGTGRPPVVAFLSLSTHGSAEHPWVEKVRLGKKLFAERFPEIECDGEMQFDAAWDVEIGRRKAPGSSVPGRANCLIFPNLDAGNIAYKITQRLAGFSAIGPILQGFARPFCDLSRGASVDDIVTASVISMLRAG